MDINESKNVICNCRKCNGIIHEIEKGDTIYNLSKKYNTTTTAIIKENKGVNPYNLMIGEKLCIPANLFLDNEVYESINKQNNFSDSEYDIEYQSINEHDMLLKELLEDETMTLSKFASILKEL